LFARIRWLLSIFHVSSKVLNLGKDTHARLSEMVKLWELLLELVVVRSSLTRRRATTISDFTKFIFVSCFHSSAHLFFFCLLSERNN
jgi:hypothetical protein